MVSRLVAREPDRRVGSSDQRQETAPDPERQVGEAGDVPPDRADARGEAHYPYRGDVHHRHGH